MTQFVGMVNWMVPKMLEKIDAYSYGILLWELVSGKGPRDGVEPGAS
jgi:hypothetical protein